MHRGGQRSKFPLEILDYWDLDLDFGPGSQRQSNFATIPFSKNCM